jgi:hypothetical protein
MYFLAKNTLQTIITTVPGHLLKIVQETETGK